MSDDLGLNNQFDDLELNNQLDKNNHGEITEEQIANSLNKLRTDYNRNYQELKEKIEKYDYEEYKSNNALYREISKINQALLEFEVIFSQIGTSSPEDLRAMIQRDVLFNKYLMRHDIFKSQSKAEKDILELQNETKENIKIAHETIKEAKTTAAEAKKSINEAKTTAAEAKKSINEANTIANEAKKSIDEANLTAAEAKKSNEEARNG
ncbi:hypothetical protein [uncultured Ilyobacter sp.]|uniref:hypothetical protein n=1 Tax=uncultured Ilyobacter sp. TaxID=544433 RepID=UPI0029C6397C|nr:hypothetical protein [uncultured Ilyobacter sp.]